MKKKCNIIIYFTLSFTSICLNSDVWSGINKWTTLKCSFNTRISVIISRHHNDSNPTLIIATQGEGIWEYFNDEVGCRPLNEGLIDKNINCIAWASNQEKILYAGSPSGLSRSVDAGSSWDSTDLNNLEIYSMATLKADTNLVLIGTNNGVYLLKEDTTYEIINLGLEGKRIKQLIVTKGNPIFIYACTSNGYLFRNINLTNKWDSIGKVNTIIGERKTEIPINVIAINPIDNNVIYVGTERWIFKRNLNKKDWETRRKTDYDFWTVTCLVANQYKNCELYAGTDKHGILYSLDYGNSWERLYDGLEDNNISTILISPYNQNLVIVGAVNGNLYSYIKDKTKKPKAALVGFQFDKLEINEGKEILNNIIAKLKNIESLNLIERNSLSEFNLKSPHTNEVEIVHAANMLNYHWYIWGNLEIRGEEKYRISLFIRDLDSNNKNTIILEDNKSKIISQSAQKLRNIIGQKRSKLTTLFWDGKRKYITLSVGGIAIATISAIISCNLCSEKKCVSKLPGPPNFP